MARPIRLYLVLSALIVVPIAVAIFAAPLVFYLYGSDVWEHMAALRQLQANAWSPSNPQLDSPEASTRYMPLYLLFALLGSAFGWDLPFTFQIIALITILLLPVAAWLFLATYFRTPWAAVYGLFLFVFGWGLPWNWTSFYDYRSLFYNVFYPSTFVLVGTFLLLWWTVVGLRDAAFPWWRGAVLAAGGGLLLLCHPLSGLFAVGAALLLAAVEPGIARERRLAAGLWLAAGIAGTALWPYYSFWQALIDNDHTQMVLWDWPVLREFYRPAEVSMMLGPALLGVPVLLYLLWRNRMYFLLIGTAGNALPYLIGYAVNFPMGHRFLPLTTFFLHLALTWAAVRLHEAFAVRHRGRGVALAAGAAAVLLLLGQALFPARDIALYAAWRRGTAALVPGFRDAGWGYRPVAAEMTALAAQTGDRAVVLSPAGDINHVLPAFAGKVVRQQRANPCVTDAAARNAAVDAFFNPDTTLAERRDTLRRFGVTHIVTATAASETAVIDTLGGLVAERWQVGPWTVAKLAPPPVPARSAATR